MSVSSASVPLPSVEPTAEPPTGPLSPPRSLARWMEPGSVELAAEELSPRDMALGLAGYLVLPLVGLLDVAGPDVVPAAVAPPVAALFLSVPSLVVGHQYLGLSASPRDLMADVGRVFVRSGRLCLGLVPAVGLYAATTGLGPIALVLSLVLVGGVSLELARRRIIRRERQASGEDAASGQRLRMVGLATAWAVLALLVAARLGSSLLLAI